MNDYKLLPLNKGRVAIVDWEDFYFLNQWKWYISSVGYVVANDRKNGKSKTLLLHNLLIKSSKGLEVDHINRNKLDNRKENLRLLPHNLNCQNRESKRISNTKLRGVSKQGNRFMSFITKRNKSIYLGSFKTAQEAHLKYLEEKNKYLNEGGYLYQ